MTLLMHWTTTHRLHRVEYRAIFSLIRDLCQGLLIGKACLMIYK